MLFKTRAMEGNSLRMIGMEEIEVIFYGRARVSETDSSLSDSVLLQSVPCRFVESGNDQSLGTFV
jgi:hypothetical protein